MGGTDVFDSGGANKGERSDALGVVVEVKPVPETTGADKFNLEQIRQTTSKARVIQGYDTSTPMLANR